MTYVSDVDSEQFMIDSLSVKAYACASSYEMNGNEIHALDRSGGGFTTKIHIVTDVLGNPVRFMLSAGNVQNIILLKRYKRCSNISG